jgi:hypothetical protein
MSQMPRFRPESPFGYDLNIEMAFVLIDGRKCEATTLLHFVILMCPQCGSQAIRDGYWRNEACSCGGEKAPVAFDDHDKLNKVNPIISTVEQRKAKRLEEEAARPWNWVFGDLTEADFPDGFAEMNGIKVDAYVRNKQ